MILRDPISLTYILITVLTLAFSYTLGDDLLTKHDRDCYAKNATLLERHAQGPLQHCRNQED